MNSRNPTSRKRSRLAESAYNSPYSHAGAPGPHPDNDPYPELRANALSTLVAMGYDIATMVERGVVWADDQDPFGHVMNSAFMHFVSMCLYRVMESYDEYLSEAEYEDMIQARNVSPVIRNYQMDIWRPVTYPDSLIAAYRQEEILPDRNTGTTSIYSLKQQAIVAEVKGAAVYMSMKTGRPVDIRTLGGGWPKVYEGFIAKSENSRRLKEKWDSEHFDPGMLRRKSRGVDSKI